MTRTIAAGAARAGLVFWACIHLLLAVLGGPSFSGATVVVVPALIAALIFFDQRISNEVVFLANVGVRPSVAPIAAAVTTLALELAVQMVSR